MIGYNYQVGYFQYPPPPNSRFSIEKLACCAGKFYNQIFLLKSLHKFITLHQTLLHSFNCCGSGQERKDIVFTTILIEWSGFNLHPAHVFAFLEKTFYDDYLCLVASNKLQIQWTRIWRNPQELQSSYWKLLSRCRFHQSRSRHCNATCADRPIVWCCLVTWG